MNDAALKPDTQDIVVDEVFPHTPETIWKTLTTANLMGRWLMMPAGFEPVEGKYFTYQTTPAGAWDGTIHCQVLEVKPNEETRARGKRRIRLTARHRGHVHPFQGRKRHAPPSRPFRLRPAEERYCLQEHERRLEEGSPEHWRYRRREGLTRRKSPWPMQRFIGRET